MKPAGVIVTMILLVAVTLADARPAQAATRNCAPGKIVAAGEYMDDVLICHADAATDGTAAAQPCLQKAARKLTATFAALERTGACQTTNDAVATMARVDTSISELLALLGNPGPGQCRRHVLTAMGKNAERQHGCYADAVARGAGNAVETACQSKATEQFLAAVTRIDSRTCATVDGPAIDALIRAAARTSRGTLAQPVTTCTPVEVTTLHGASFVPNSRLARIENGQVACMHVDDLTIAACAFSTVAGSDSGEWLESPQGRFALVGQAVSLIGIPGGEYVVAAKVSDTTPAACVEGTGMDTLGTIMDGMELSATCAIEELLAPWNILSAWGWYPLVNYADREVCSSDRTHPDNAFLVRAYPASGSGPDDTFCYAFFGAGLNDINGVERDLFGRYIPGEDYCHYLIAGGHEVPAAKRPAIRTFPAPAAVKTDSAILWRPATTAVAIANGETRNLIQNFNQKDTFLLVTGAKDASGPLPDLGEISDRATIGSLTFSLALGGNSFAIGASGSDAAPDWYPLMAGNEIAFGYETLQVQLATPVYAFGFDIVEPNTTMPDYGGTPGDSTFEVVLYRGSTEVKRTTFNAADDVVTFFGIWSNWPFDRVTIVDLSGNPDDEYFGRFYTGKNQK